jgi:hypothetical protein
MSKSTNALQKRIKLALEAIKAAFGSEDDEFGTTLFVSHHLAELEESYWEEHLQTSAPAPSKVLDILVLSPRWTSDHGINGIDFTLPGDVTNYIICVNFDEDGEVEDIAMES